MDIDIDHGGFDHSTELDLDNAPLDTLDDAAIVDLDDELDDEIDELRGADDRFELADEHRVARTRSFADDALSQVLSGEIGENAIVDRTPGEESFSHSSYFGTARARPLLNAAQERQLGRALLSAREELTTALSAVPRCWEQLAEAWQAAVAGDRQISEVLQWPLGTPGREEPSDLDDMSDDDPDAEVTAKPLDASDTDASGGGVTTPREQMKVLAAQMSEWRGRTVGWRRRGLPKAPEEGQALFVHLGPAFAMLSELLGELEQLRRRAQSPEEVRAVELLAGVPLAVIEAACEKGKEEEQRFQRARRVMFESNIRLVFFIAGKFTNNGLSLEDLVQEGNIGLLRAVEKFDHRLGYKFSTYASTWIWQAVTRAIANHRRTIRVPAHLHDKMLKVRSISNRLEQETGKAPSLETLSEKSGLSVQTVVRALEAGRSTLSLDSPVGSDEGTSFGDLTPDPALREASEPVHDEELSVYLEKLLDELPAREALIVRLRHGLGGTEPHTLEEIGAILSITRERTRQLQNRALRALKARLPADIARSLV